jgi:hypothetical protein
MCVGSCRARARAASALTRRCADTRAQVFYVLYRIVWGWASFGLLQWLGFFFLTAVNVFCAQTILRCAELGAPYECVAHSVGALARGPFSPPHAAPWRRHYEDILYVNCFVMVMSAIAWWGWLFYLVVPGYLVYRFGRQVLGWLGSSSGEPEAEQEPSAANGKKAAKKQRKEERPRFRVVRG